MQIYELYNKSLPQYEVIVIVHHGYYSYYGISVRCYVR